MRRTSWFVGLFAIVLCMAPAATLLARDVHRPADVHWSPVWVMVAIAVAGFFVARALRKAASVRYLDRSVRHRRAGASPAFAFTLVGWLVVGPAFGFAAATALVAYALGEPDLAEDLPAVAGSSLPVQFVLAAIAVLAVAGYYSWSFRRRHELPVLKQAGIAIVVEPPRTQPLRVTTTMWLAGTLIDGSLFAGAIVPRLLSDDDRPSSNELASGVFGVVGGPGLISFLLLMAMLVYGPGRASALDALRQRSSIAAIALVLGGGAISEVGGPYTVAGVAGGIILLIGLLIGSATCLNIMDRGTQPWLGLLFLAGNYVLGYLGAPDGNGTALPRDVTGWVVAVLAAAYAIHQAREHYREWTRVVNLREVTPQP